MDCFECSGDLEYCKTSTETVTCPGQAYSYLYQTTTSEITVIRNEKLVSLQSQSVFKGCAIENERYCEEQNEVNSGLVDCKVSILSRSRCDLSLVFLRSLARSFVCQQ